MAEGILWDVASSVIGKLVTYAEQEIGKILGVKDALDNFERTARRIQAVLRDADQQQTLNYQDQDWIKNLKEALDDAEELLNDFSTEARKREDMRGNKVTKEVRLFFSRSNQLSYGWNMAKKLEEIENRLNKAIRDREDITLTIIPQTKTSDLTDASLPEVVIGRETDKQEIVARLLGSNEKDMVIPILGMGGMGKTTLAQMVFNDKRVSDSFDLKMWICLPRDFYKKLILQKILESLTTKKAEDLDDETLRMQISEKVNEKKFLLVLDDLWNEDPEKWDNLFKILKGIGTSESKIILTTRLKRAAQIAHTKIHRLGGLSDIESWKLLKQYAFYQGQVPENLGLVGIGKDIASMCLGVPLVIKTVGRLLNGKTIDEWLSFKDDELSKIAQNDDNILKRLKLSYYHLPLHLKDCFTYCSLFPKGFEIDVKTLVQLWIAQGFVKASKSQKQLEDVGHEYFKELWWRSFLQDVKKDTLRNLISCRMHDLMHDLAMSIAGIETIILNANDDDVDRKALHVSFNFNLDATWQISPSLYRAKNLKTFLLPIQKLESDIEGANNANYEATTSNFVRLRVFDIHDLGIEEVPSTIKKLKYLRYLDASRNRKLEFLPIDITKLSNLVTLKLSGCTQLKQLPKKITKLVNLSCLDCEGCWNLSHMPRGLGKLTSLHTLTWFVVAKKSSILKRIGGLEELHKLNNLEGKIEIRNLRFVKDDKSESALAKMEDKKHLQSLTLSWNVEANDNDIYSDYSQRSSKCSGDDHMDANNVVDAKLEKKILESLKPHKKLKVLRVYEYGGKIFPSWLSTITNLVEIWIVNCKQLQHIPPMDQLPFLRELWLSELPDLIYIDDREDTCNSGRTMFFPSLKQLRIWSCPNLYGWWKKGSDDNDCDNAITTRIVELPEFPHLHTLDIRGCPNLTWMPMFSLSNGKLLFRYVDLTRLQQISGLGKVRFLNCLASFSNIVELSVSDCEGCHYFPPMDQLPLLAQIYFDNVKNLEYIGTEAIHATRRGGEGSNFFPSLKKLWILRCPDFKGWWKETNDDEDNDDTIINSTIELPQFPCLSLLRICDCPQLIQLPLFPTVDDHLALSNTSLNAFRQTLDMQISSSQLAHERFFSGLSLFTNLKELFLGQVADLEYVGLESFALLKKVSLWDCPNLKSWFKKSDNGVYDSTTTTTLLHFPALSTLSIIDCPILTEMPMFPGLDDSLCLRNASIEPFLQTVNLTTTAAFINLRELDIGELGDLEYIGIKAFPCLEKVCIENCPNLKSWWKNTAGGSSNDGPTAATTRLEFPHFSTLTDLRIRGCPNLTQMPLFPLLDGVLRLENTSIKPLERTLKMKTSSSTVHPLSRLRDLSIVNIKDIKSLPGVENLTSLKALFILDCPRLRSLPKGIHLLKNLELLSISGCLLLIKRCARHRGADWPYIAHIPTIDIDSRTLQRPLPVYSNMLLVAIQELYDFLRSD